MGIDLMRIVACVVCLLVIGVPAMTDDLPDDVYWQPGQGIPGIDGHVYALTVYDGRLIAGGFFEVAGNACARNIAAWDGTSWSPLGEGMDDRVIALAVYNGKLIAGGYFQTAGGIPARHIASWDGGSWEPLSSGMGSGVEALASYGDDLIVGGRFSDAGGVPVNYIASWNGADWDSLGSGMNESVFALAVYDNRLIAGGYFTSAGGIPAAHIVAWDGAAWDTLGSGTDNTIYALSVYDGSLVVGGAFSSAGGVSASHIASWAGGVWTPLGSGINWDVNELTVCGGLLVAAGEFNAAGGIAARGIASWDGVAWAPLGAGFDGDELQALTCYEGDVIAAGYFHDAGGVAAENIAVWDGVAWSAPGEGWMGNIGVFAVYDGKLIAGGSFLEIEGAAASRIASWDGAAWSPLGTGMNADVAALTVCGGKLVAGGEFTTAGGVTVACVASWDGSAWAPMGSINIAGQNGRPVELLGCYNGSPIAATWYYDSHADQNWWFIYRWDGGAWTCIGDGIEPNMNALGINAFDVYDNELIAAGSFQEILGVPAVGLAAWDGSSWSGVGSGGGALWTYALGVHEGELYVGGAFGHLRSWEGSVWSSFLSGIGDFDCFYTFTSMGDSLVIGGGFPTYGSSLGNNIIVWDGTDWAPLGSGLNGYVTALEVYDNTIFAAGSFTIAGGKVSAHLARWTREPAVAVLISGFRANPVAGGIELCWSLTSDERIEGFRIYRSRAGEADENPLNGEPVGPDKRSYMDETVLLGERYNYTLAALVAGGREVRSITVESGRPQVALRLFQNAPNPFNPSTAIRFTIPQASHIELRVYNTSGRLVRTLADGKMPAGAGEVTWDGTNDAGSTVASGVYFYRLRVGKSTLSRKMLLLR